jgi:hypothetical protein
MATQWTSERLAYASDVLALKRSVEGAAARLSDDWGTRISAAALKDGFRRAGLPSPSTYAKGQPLMPTELLDDEDRDTDEVAWAPRVSPMAYEVDDEVERVALIPDAHIPDHDQVAWPLALRAIEVFRPHTLVVLGDLGDFASVSSHGHSPSKTERLLADFDAVNEQLDIVDAMAARVGVTRKVFATGNHCARIARYIAERCPELHGTLSLERNLNLVGRGWEVVPYKSHATIGRLHVTHDCGHSGSTAAARSRDTYGADVAVGHCHAANISYRGSATGESRVGMSAGFLADRAKITYMHSVDVMRNWQHGFGVAYVERATGIPHVHFIPIQSNGTAIVEGRIVR